MGVIHNSPLIVMTETRKKIMYVTLRLLIDPLHNFIISIIPLSSFTFPNCYNLVKNHFKMLVKKKKILVETPIDLMDFFGFLLDI